MGFDNRYCVVFLGRLIILFCLEIFICIVYVYYLKEKFFMFGKYGRFKVSIGCNFMVVKGKKEKKI